MFEPLVVFVPSILFCSGHHYCIVRVSTLTVLTLLITVISNVDAYIKAHTITVSSILRRNIHCSYSDIQLILSNGKQQAWL